MGASLLYIHPECAKWSSLVELMPRVSGGKNKVKFWPFLGRVWVLVYVILTCIFLYYIL